MTKQRRVGVYLAIGVLVLIAAMIGAGQLATLRSQPATALGVVAGKAIYLSPSFNGSGWIQIDPDNLKDISARPLLDIPPTTANSSTTQVSADGSTIIVSDFSPGAVTRRVYDGRTGRLRGYLVPQVAMVIDHLSADGTLAAGRLGDNRSPLTAENVVIATEDGRVMRRLFQMDIPGEIQASMVSPDLTTRYYVTTPAPVSFNSATSQSLQYSLVVRSWTDALSGPILLPGITAGTILRGPTPASMPINVRPAIAISADGGRLAALSADGSTLDVVETNTLALTTLTVRKKTSLLDLLGPLIADAKTINDEERRSMAFTPDGSALISWLTATHYDENGPSRTTLRIQRIDLQTGVITAESSAPAGIYSFAMSPDGRSIYLIVRANEPPSPVYAVRRLDAQSLELKAERVLADYAELEVLAAPAPSADTISPPTSVVCGPMTALVASPQHPGLSGAPIGPLLIRGPYAADAKDATALGFVRGRPLKMLVLIAQNMEREITLTGARCSDGQPLRFWLNKGGGAIWTFDATSAAVPDGVMASTGDLRAVLPAAAPGSSYGGYMLFRSSGAYRIEAFADDRKIGDATIFVSDQPYPGGQ